MGGTPKTALAHKQLRVILVRHGQSTYNAQKRYQGSCDDSVLTDKGHQSAYQTGVALKTYSVDAIYTSPLRRTQETAKDILQAFAKDIPLQTHPCLQEISMPGWESLSFEYVREHFVEEYRCWKEKPHEFAFIDSSFVTSHLLLAKATTSLQIKDNKPPRTKQFFPVLDLYEKAGRFWQEILPRHAGQTVLIVSHAGTIRALIGTAIALSPARYHTLQQSNCGVSILKFSHPFDQSAKLEAMNFTTHLGEVLPKLKEGKHGLRLLLVPSSGANPNSIEKLAVFLHKEAIAFCISTDFDKNQHIAEKILQYHPSTVHLQTLRLDFPRLWQQTIQSCSIDSTSLTTGLVVADDTIIQQMLGQVLELSADQQENLQLISGTMSIVHYPVAHRKPVLQALNISSTELH